MPINPQIEDSWKEVLWDQFQAPYFAQLKAFLVEEKRQYQVFPPGPCIFNAFNSTPFEEVKVVIIGQDPYHDVGQAHGLCFSVQDGVPFPRSLQNIFKELHDDVGFQMPRSGNLQKWAAQGILLLNATLTVRAHCAGSHRHEQALCAHRRPPLAPFRLPGLLRLPTLLQDQRTAHPYGQNSH